MLMIMIMIMLMIYEVALLIMIMLMIYEVALPITIMLIIMIYEVAVLIREPAPLIMIMLYINLMKNIKRVYPTFLFKKLILSSIYFDKLYIIGPTGDQYIDLERINPKADIEFNKDIKDLPSPDKLPKI